MSFYQLIARKRNGGTLSPSEIKQIIAEYTSGKIPDYQMSAFLMAIYFQGLNDLETRALTENMLHSGEVIDLTDIPGMKVDKHSTGGVGDKVSIILAPIVAVAGVPVPMISGRGLGHTGGTLDKLESIPGFRTNFNAVEFKAILKNHGLCLSGQSKNLVPADSKLYALRDVTATVESIPLVVASILSKKLAEGIDALVLDVKTGSGAFMTEPAMAEELASQLIRVGEDAGVRTVAYLTSMEEPLGFKIGNWLEILECIDALHGKGPDDLMELTHRLAGTMIHLGGKAESTLAGIRISEEIVSSGKAWDKFLEIVKAQGGDISVVENPERSPFKAEKMSVKAEKSGYVAALNARDIGLASVLLGAGRQKVDDSIHPAAGIILHKKTGDQVREGEPLMTLYSGNKVHLEPALSKIRTAVTYSETRPPQKSVILKYMDKTALNNGISV